MSKIKIQNFGPIKEGLKTNDGWIEINKVTVFIGNQGSGKSTVAKLFSTLSWLEKSINRGDTQKGKISFNKFIEFTKYHKIHNYFRDDTFIDFIGDKYQITYDRRNNHPIIKTTEKSEYLVPKIMYVPAERNFLFAISDAYEMKGLPENLFTFAEELKKAQKALKGMKVDLQIGSYQYEYNEDDDNSFVVGKDYRINLLEASSGLQAFTPMFLVSNELSSAIAGKEDTQRKNMSVTQSIRMNNEITELVLNNSILYSAREKRIEEIREKYYSKCFINIVEEPELNLFPTSQWEMLKSLLEFNNINFGNKLIMTTHSPYIINYLSVIIQAAYLGGLLVSKSLIKKLNNIVPIKSNVEAKEVVIYQLDETSGTISKLEKYDGIPSDHNYLNESLAEGNRLFDSLLEIEQER